MSRRRISPPSRKDSRARVPVTAGLLIAAAALIYFGSAVSKSEPPSPARLQLAPATDTPSPPVRTLLPPSQGASGRRPAALPPLPVVGYPAARPPQVVRAAYAFAAEHPDILRYVPCYCGCEREGHRANDDCFVATRAADGGVISWDAHGMT